MVLSSSQEDTDIETAYMLGANAYIVKAVDFDKFHREISGAGLYWLTINQPPKA